MGYNTRVLFAKNLDREQIADLIPDVFEITDESIGFDEASSYSLAPNLAIGESNNWTIIWDANGKLAGDRNFIEQFAICEAVSFELSSIVDGYVITYARQQKVMREIIYHSGKKIIDKGDRLTWEKDTLDEDNVWQSIAQITSITLSILVSLKYNLVVLD